jgi:uncharacterized protein YjbI with pentapeptide repeats
MNAWLEEWREEWLKAQYCSIPTWSELAKRNGGNGISEQDFWRTAAGGRHRLSDDEMLESGLLTKAGRKIYHSAYVPWRFPNGEGKEKWSDKQWKVLSDFISQKSPYDYIGFNSLEWLGLTLTYDLCQPFFNFGARLFYVIGDSDLSRYPHLIKENFFAGNVSGIQTDIERCVVMGNIYSSQGMNIKYSKIGSIFHNGSSGFGEIEIHDSVICEFTSSYKLLNMNVENSDLFNLNLSGCDIGKISISSENSNKIGLRMNEARVAGRFNIVGCDISSSSSYEISDDQGLNYPFSHAKFEQKLRIIESKFKLSDLSDVQFSSQVDIEFFSRNVEDAFEAELAEIKAARKSLRRPSEVRRQRLERACQLLCERHRQDGRKDLEHRFRRMELKARAYRADADRGTRAITWCYSFFPILEEA